MLVAMLALRPRLPDFWLFPDERFEGLLEIGYAIHDAFDVASGLAAGPPGEDDVYPEWTPLRLAGRMREAADRIERATER